MKKSKLITEALINAETPLSKYYDKLKYVHDSTITLTEHKDIDSAINDINAKIQDVENQKYKFRDKIYKLVSLLIVIQLIFFNSVVLIIIMSLTMDIPSFKTLDITLSANILSFLKYFISVTIAELLSMLFFIMKYVFTPFKITKSKSKKSKNGLRS